MAVTGKASTPQQVADMIRVEAEKIAQMVETATEVVEFSGSMHQRTTPVNEPLARPPEIRSIRETAQESCTCVCVEISVSGRLKLRRSCIQWVT